MAVLTVNQPAASVDGWTVPALSAAASGGDSFSNSGTEIVRIANGHDSATRTVTFASVPDLYGRSGDIAVVIPAGATEEVGPFLPQNFNDSDGRIQITYSDSAADITVGVFAPTSGQIV